MKLLNISRLNKGRKLWWHGFATRKDNRHKNGYIKFGERKRKLKRYYNKYLRRKDFGSGGNYKKAYDYQRELF